MNGKNVVGPRSGVVLTFGARPTAAERFSAKVVRDDLVSGCWLWTGAVNNCGYGVFKLDGRTVLAHRFAYTLVHGEIPEGVVLLHTCDNPRCVVHLKPGTQAENLADMRQKGRAHLLREGNRFVARGPSKLAALAAAHESPRALKRLNAVTE